MKYRCPHCLTKAGWRPRGASDWMRGTWHCGTCGWKLKTHPFQKVALALMVIAAAVVVADRLLLISEALMPLNTLA